VGTHALVAEGTKFAEARARDHRRAAPVRCGAAARRGRGEARGGEAPKPDVLLMSATPIPRSLALTLYGDLDVSVLDERPPGRQPVTTALRPESARERVLAFVDRQIEAGAAGVHRVSADRGIGEGRAEGGDHGVRGADGRRAAGGAWRCCTGGSRGREGRDHAGFRDGALDVLVSTTVIEVGIDVPNATVMLIEHPERFGLSQLHQLRGRVGRGAEESYCILLGDVGEEAMSGCACSWRPKTGSRSRARTSGCAGWATCSASGRAGCRPSASPTRCATRS
jgi:ATP-dependent DNA helicase RecG